MKGYVMLAYKVDGEHKPIDLPKETEGREILPVYYGDDDVKNYSDKKLGECFRRQVRRLEERIEING